MFDNRTLICKAGLPGIQKRFDDMRGLGRSHFCLQVGNQRLGYCYIRKNACSSFKRMFLELSSANHKRVESERPIDFMLRHHCMQTRDFLRCDRMILVYRDPVSRILSMFRNKFIARTGAEDSLRFFEQVEGCKVDDTSFRKFVESYLQKDFGLLDRHVLPQRMHLRRTVYTDVIQVEDLHDRMTDILGSTIADKYFLRPTNRTSDLPLRPIPGAADLPLGKVRQIFLSQGIMPDNESFLAEEVEEKLMARYAMDYRLLGETSTEAARPA